jgi:segregation and condensation protein B
VIYATTPAFLAHFGLASRRDLPGIDDLRAAGLLDPVEDAFEEAMAGKTPAADHAVEPDDGASDPS